MNSMFDQPESAVADWYEEPLVGVILDIFRTVLGRADLAADDSLRKAGCDTSQAAEALRSLRRRGFSLRSQDVPREDSVRRLAVVAREEVAFDGRAWEPYRPGGRFTAIRPDGSAAPFLVVHPAIGEPLSVWSLRATDLGRPVFGIRAVGLAPGERPLPSIAELARRYIEEMDLTGFEPPYLIGGYSLGGMIALSIAQHLIADGRRVAALIILDTQVSLDRSGQAQHLQHHLNLDTIRRVRRQLLIQETRERTGRGLPVDASERSIHGVLREEELIESESFAEFQRLQEVWCHCVLAAMRFECPPVPVRTVYFRGLRGRDSRRQQQYWQSLQGDFIEFRSYPESHDTLLRSPMLRRDLAKILRAGEPDRA